MDSHEHIEVAIAWYRRDQWALLRTVSVDADKLEPTYDEWHSFASQHVRELEAKGIHVVKTDVEVGALTRWCESEGRAIDGDARAAYAMRGLGPRV